MKKEQALAVLYEALASCEGLEEMKTLGINPISLQEKMEEEKMVSEHLGEHFGHAIEGAKALLDQLAAHDADNQNMN